jgi:mRNA interferase MazF
MAKPSRGDVWLVDLAYTAKVRPCLILSDYPSDNELALVVVVPHTTAVRNNRWEFTIAKPFLKSGAFHLQQIQPISLPKLERKLGTLTDKELEGLGRKIVQLLKLPATA